MIDTFITFVRNKKKEFYFQMAITYSIKIRKIVSLIRIQKKNVNLNVFTKYFFIPWIERIDYWIFFAIILHISLPCPTHLPGMCAPQVKLCWASTCHCRIRSRLPRAVALSKEVSIPAATSRELRRRAPACKRWPNRSYVKSWMVYTSYQ